MNKGSLNQQCTRFPGPFNDTLNPPFTFTKRTLFGRRCHSLVLGYRISDIRYQKHALRPWKGAEYEFEGEPEIIAYIHRKEYLIYLTREIGG